MSQRVVSFEGDFDVGMFKQFCDEFDLTSRISECGPFCSGWHWCSGTVVLCSLVGGPCLNGFV